MATPKELCDAKYDVVREWHAKHTKGEVDIGHCNWDRALFEGCPSCGKEAEAGVTVEAAKADMTEFMYRINSDRVKRA
jgi:hypothetical protein